LSKNNFRQATKAQGNQLGFLYRTKQKKKKIPMLEKYSLTDVIFMHNKKITTGSMYISTIEQIIYVYAGMRNWIS
jgi:hypothetical protein